MYRVSLRAFSGPLLLLALLALTGCWSSADDDLQPKEIRKDDKEMVDAPAEALFQSGKKLYASGLFSVSRESFDSLRANYPLSPYSEFAEIKSADALYESSEFENAATAYEEFIKNHPGSAAIPYVMMRAGRSYHQSHRGVGRDKTNLEKALEVYDRLIKSYPESLYAKSAERFRLQTVDSLAEHDRFVRGFYERRERDKAVDARRARYTKKWEPLLESVKPAPVEMVKAARRRPTPLETPTLVTASRIERETSKSQPVPRAAAPSGPSGIQRVMCDSSDGDVVTVELARPLASGEAEWRREGDEVVVQIPGVSANARTIDCFARQDLTVSPDGTVRVASSAEEAQLVPVSRPPRLLVFLGTEE